MTAALWLMAVQGLIGGFDTAWYHEWRARLPALGRAAASELRLHAVRDVLYAVIFGTLPWVQWRGAWALAFAGVIVAEIVFTLWDFIVEIGVRKPIGDVYGGERVTHAIMGIVYGAMVANLIPSILSWWAEPSLLAVVPAPIPQWLRWTLSVMAAGVLASGVRDLYASTGRPHGNWPWPVESASGAVG